MPHVTTWGSEKLNWDITQNEWDPKTGKIVSHGNGLKELNLTASEHFDYEPNGDLAKEMLVRGQPNPVEMNWNELPVFRILTNRFESGHDVSNMIEGSDELLKTDWGRFMRDYEAQVKCRTPVRTWFYEPSIEDVKVDTETKFHYPLWVIEKLIEFGEFEQALKVNKVNLPSKPKLTKPEYDRIMKEIEKRREKESGNVSRSSKQSASKAS
jgi:hypothetical protein